MLSFIDKRIVKLCNTEKNYTLNPSNGNIFQNSAAFGSKEIFFNKKYVKNDNRNQ